MTKLIGAQTLEDALYALGGLIAENEEKGEKSFIFCEDKVTLLAERAVLDAVGATFLTEVTTFARFLSSDRRVLSKQGSVMAISQIIAKSEKELHCFHKNAAQTVYETIAQLSASCVGEELLLKGAEETDGTLRGKLVDLALICERYGEFLREHDFVDESGYLSLLPSQIERAGLQDTHIFFFAFPSFTKQSRAGVETALQCGKDVTGIFLAGKEELYTNEGAHSFRKLCEEQGGVEIFRTESTLTGDALHLRQGLFSPERYLLPKRETECVRRFVADDEGKELETVAALIKKKVASGMRYREIAVLVPDQEVFPVMEKVFTAYRIPFYADKKRPFSAHPFCAFVFSVLDGAADGVLPEEADAILSSVYFGQAEEYRNYLLRFGGYRGAYRKEIKSGEAVKGYDTAKLSACRERLRTVMSFFSGKGTGIAYCQGIRSVYEFLSGNETTERLSERFTGAEKQFLEIDPLWNVLEEIQMVAGGQSFSAREFSAMLKSGLDSLEISMIPQYCDAVFVGDATDSRFQRVRVVFATGLTDALPRIAQDTAVISDREIERLGQLQVEIEPAIAQVNARARESIALNLCAFTDELYLSYPLQKGGQECNRSEIFTAAEKLFSMPPMPDLFPFDCAEPAVAVRKLLSLKREFESGGEDVRDRFGALYTALCQTGEKEQIDRLLKGNEKKNVPLQELYFHRSLSPTFFEKYFACPYKGFAENGLRLKEREEGSVRPVDAGNFIHAVLQETAGHFAEIGTEEQCRQIAESIAQETIKKPNMAHLADTNDGKYTGDRLVKESVEVTAAAYRQLIGSAFTIRKAEADVSLDELHIRGRADRVDESDEYVRIIDYKTGSFDVSSAAYYTGQKLQLQLYLKAASEGGVPAGAFYFPAADNFVKPDENKYRMEGFYSGEDAVLLRMDRQLQEGASSAFFEGKRNGSYTEKGMKQEDFEAFLDYGVLVAQRAEGEMKGGNIAPSPYQHVCEYCKLQSLCGFVGTPRKEETIKNSEIVEIVKRERGDRE